MPITLRSALVKIKGNNGEYTSVDVVANESTDAILGRLEDKEAELEAAIEAKGQETLDSIPDSYEEIQEEIDDLDDALDEDRNLLGYTVNESINRWNPSEQSTDKQISSASATKGELIDGTGYTTSGFIPATKNDIFRWDYSNSAAEEGDLLARGTTVLRVGEYDLAGNCLFVSASWATLPYTVQSDNTASIRVSVATRATNSIVFGDTSTSQITYTPFAVSVDFERIKSLEASNDLIEVEINEINDELDNIDSTIQKCTILNTQLETGVREYITTSDKVGEVHQNAQISDNVQVTYTISGNRHLLLSILPVAKLLNVVTFYMNPLSAQWGSVIVLSDATGYRVNGSNLSVSDVEANTINYLTFNSSTRLVTIDIDALKQTYPTAATLWLSSNADKNEMPSVQITNEMLLSDFEWLIDDSGEMYDVGLTLPAKIPVVVGIPAWCYYENTLAKAFLKDYTVTTDGNARTRREVLKDIRSISGNFSKTVSVYLRDTLIKQQTFQICAVSKETAETHHVNILCIGDSKTEATGKRIRINELVSNDEYLNLDFLGTNGSSPTLSEGYSGRNIVDVCTSATLNGNENIFYDSSITGDIKFNFSVGVSKLTAVPDIVFIDHGANQYGIAWVTIRECYEAIISSIHAYDAGIKVVICVQESAGLAIKPDYTQGNKVGYGLGNSDTNYSIPKMVDAFDNRENNNVFLCPQYLCVDLYRDFPLALLPVSEDNALKEYLCLDTTHPGTNINSWNASVEYAMYAYVKRNGTPYAALQASQGVDPATDNGTYWTPIVNPEAGYNKIGDMYYAVIKYIVSLT